MLNTTTNISVGNSNVEYNNQMANIMNEIANTMIPYVNEDGGGDGGLQIENVSGMIMGNVATSSNISTFQNTFSSQNSGTMLFNTAVTCHNTIPSNNVNFVNTGQPNTITTNLPQQTTYNMMNVCLTPSNSSCTSSSVTPPTIQNVGATPVVVVSTSSASSNSNQGMGNTSFMQQGMVTNSQLFNPHLQQQQQPLMIQKPMYPSVVGFSGLAHNNRPYNNNVTMDSSSNTSTTTTTTYHRQSRNLTPNQEPTPEINVSEEKIRGRPSQQLPPQKVSKPKRGRPKCK